MLLKRIDAFLRRTRTSPTRFGRDALGDPNFVLNLRDGRVPRASTAMRVHQYLDEREPAPDATQVHR
jgi:hypothetical protein